MRLSNSKKQLAKIIHENGGWREGAEFTAQDGDGTGSIDFFKSKPRLYRGNIFWRGNYDCDDRIERTGVTIKNWHQTILSRDEYFRLYPAPDAEGWIEWNGGKCPVDVELAIYVNYRDGGKIPEAVKAGSQRWNHSGLGGDIMSYSLHKTEVKPELCESVMRSIPDPEAKPTIEQLATDYRNAKDYAERKQQEADAAKIATEAKLAELVATGKALGLVLSIAGVEPELGITVEVGDEVECVKPNVKLSKYKGMIGTVLEIDDSSTPYLVDFNEEDRIWCHAVKFIRRP